MTCCRLLDVIAHESFSISKARRLSMFVSVATGGPPIPCKSGERIRKKVMKESQICSCVCGEAHEPANGFKDTSFDWIVGSYSCNLHMYAIT